MPRIEHLSDAQREAVLNFACFEYDSAPFVPLRYPLEKVRLENRPLRSSNRVFVKQSVSDVLTLRLLRSLPFVDG